MTKMSFCILADSHASWVRKLARIFLSRQRQIVRCRAHTREGERGRDRETDRREGEGEREGQRERKEKGEREKERERYLHLNAGPLPVPSSQSSSESTTASPQYRAVSPPATLAGKSKKSSPSSHEVNSNMGSCSCVYVCSCP